MTQCKEMWHDHCGCVTCKHVYVTWLYLNGMTRLYERSVKWPWQNEKVDGMLWKCTVAMSMKLHKVKWSNDMMRGHCNRTMWRLTTMLRHYLTKLWHHTTHLHVQRHIQDHVKLTHHMTDHVTLPSYHMTTERITLTIKVKNYRWC